MDNQELILVRPDFKIFYVGGMTAALPQNTMNKLYKLMDIPYVQAYDIANLAVSETRLANRTSSAVGDRASAIVLPANGWIDTGLWDNPKEALHGAIPRMIFLDGRQWEPSEMKLKFEDVFIGEFQKHSLLFKSLSEGRLPKRTKRKMSRFRSVHQAPTIFQLIGECLYGTQVNTEDFLFPQISNG